MSRLQYYPVSTKSCKSESGRWVRRDTSLVPTVKTAVLLGKCQYQESTEINSSLTFTNNIKGL